MIRARFKTSSPDPRPVNWPIQYPYWVTGYGENYTIIVAYAADDREILKNWPEAEDIEYTEERDFYFSDRFPKPIWFNIKQKAEEALYD